VGVGAGDLDGAQHPGNLEIPRVAQPPVDLVRAIPPLECSSDVLKLVHGVLLSDRGIRDGESGIRSLFANTHLDSTKKGELTAESAKNAKLR
jgi:hypothetical protein